MRIFISIILCAVLCACGEQAPQSRQHKVNAGKDQTVTVANENKLPDAKQSVDWNDFLKNKGGGAGRSGDLAGGGAMGDGGGLPTPDGWPGGGGGGFGRGSGSAAGGGAGAGGGGGFGGGPAGGASPGGGLAGGDRRPGSASGDIIGGGTGVDDLSRLLRDHQIKALQPVYFATNRDIREPAPLQLSSITERRSMSIKYGVAVVSVPKNHVIGNIERPKFKYLLWKYEPETDQDHFRMKLLTGLTRDKFVERLRGQSDSVLLFIHGYNVTFGDAIYRAAQIAYDANFDGSVLVFSWPSAGELFKYDYDRESAEFSGGDLLQIFRILTEEIGEKRIYIVAHSLGNQVLVNALQQASLSKVKLNIAELVLAAPDVDKDVFMKKASEIMSVAKNVTMYASSADKALLASDKKAWGTRMGYIDENGPNLVDGIETIDVTAVGDDMFGLDHSTFAVSRAVLDDLGRLISSTSHLLPNQRTPTLKFMPDKDNVRYWLYPR